MFHGLSPVAGMARTETHLRYTTLCVKSHLAFLVPSLHLTFFQNH